MPYPTLNCYLKSADGAKHTFTVGKTQFGGIYWITLIQFIFVPKRIIFVNMAKACLLLGLMLVCAVFAKHDEWYCKVDSDKFQICRKCKTLEEDCDYEAPDNCKCENMKFANTDCKLDFFNGILTSTFRGFTKFGIKVL